MTPTKPIATIGQVQIEYPAPSLGRCQSTADQRARDTTNGPHDVVKSKVVAPLTQWNHVRDQNLGQRQDTTPTSALDRAAGQHHGEIARDGADDRTDGEESHGKEKEWSTATVAGKGDEAGLPYGRGEQERSASPEGFDGIAMKGNGDDLGIHIGECLGIFKRRKMIESTYRQCDGDHGGVKSAGKVDNND
ncbi:MAG: hypothetical protein L6R42_004125 [Xanthoria sp. 1 TBL-2021]|nr:MAG: hypothetical protein L6R42_004125 [Xanthoria sp. 1 TBL-2021]